MKHAIFCAARQELLTNMGHDNTNYFRDTALCAVGTGGIMSITGGRFTCWYARITYNTVHIGKAEPLRMGAGRWSMIIQRLLTTAMPVFKNCICGHITSQNLIFSTRTDCGLSAIQ
jgi:hypothetical protein